MHELFLVLHAIDRLRFPRAVHDIALGVAVMVVAIVFTVGVLLIQRRVIRLTQSTAIRADALHYGTDVLANLGIIVALFLSAQGWVWADPLFAIGIAVYIFYSAARIGYDASQQLMDRELPTEVQEQILSIARRSSEVRGVHDLRTRQSGHVKRLNFDACSTPRSNPRLRSIALAPAACVGQQGCADQDPTPCFGPRRDRS